MTLLNGTKIPQVGLGTFLSTEGDVEPVVKAAVLDHGYRHIDTASLYKNEEAIGRALKECIQAGVKREDLFVTTKLYQNEKDDVEGALRTSLAKLQLEYVDLYLIHWMLPKFTAGEPLVIHDTPLHKVWAELERLVDLGLVKNIGISNCTVALVVDLWSYARIKPVMNQIELHPYLPQQALVNFIRDKLGVHVTAYSPIGSTGFNWKSDSLKTLNLLQEPIIVELATKYSKSPAQIALNWHIVHRKHVVIPKTTKAERLGENLQSYNFTLSKEEYEKIDSLENGARFFNPINWAGYLNAPLFD